MSFPEFMNWKEYFEKKVKPHTEHLDAWDTTILSYAHSKLRKFQSPVDIALIKSEVVREIGFITDEELAKRLDKLENLGLIRRMVRLS